MAEIYQMIKWSKKELSSTTEREMLSETEIELTKLMLYCQSLYGEDCDLLPGVNHFDIDINWEINETL